MIRMEFISANPQVNQAPTTIKYFNSYQFDRNIMTPASAFRFTAPGVDKEVRMQIRSGDTVRLFCDNDLGHTAIVGVGFVDETDTHGTPDSLEYVLTGRDTIGQLVDNDTVDSKNQIIFFQTANIDTIVSQLIAGTRMIQSHRTTQMSTSRTYAFHTDPGETRINALQRILSWCNGLVWANNDGTLIVGKPNFTQSPAGRFFCLPSVKNSNVLEFRVRRNINQAIRQMTTVLNGTEAAASEVLAGTLQNMDKGLKPYRGTNVGRSVSRTFSYATGEDTINQGTGVGQGSYAPHTLANEYTAREIAQENIKILDVEIVVEGHFNEAGYLYNIDQIYQVDIEDENVSEPLYVYNVSYELTMDHGMITRMRLCRLWTICSYADQLPRVAQPVTKAT